MTGTLSSTDRSNPIFVTGYMHSGTTLLMSVLARDPSIFIGDGETRFFDYLPVIRREFANLEDDAVIRGYVTYLAGLALTNYTTMHLSANRSVDLKGFGVDDQQMDLMVAEAMRIRDHGRIFGMVFDALTRFFGKKRWLEKTPTHLFHVDEILGAIPEALFVELVRDPRDILASKAIRRSESWLSQFDSEIRAQKQFASGFDPLWDSLGWKSAIHASDESRARYPQAIHRVRYEDLVTNPQAELERICAFLGLGFTEEMLKVSWINTTVDNKASARGIASDSVAKWQRILSSGDVALCQWIVGEEMERLGYARAPTTPAAWAKLPLLLGRSGLEFLGRLYRRWRLGGSAYLVNVLGKYWRRVLALVNGGSNTAPGETAQM